MMRTPEEQFEVMFRARVTDYTVTTGGFILYSWEEQRWDNGQNDYVTAEGGRTGTPALSPLRPLNDNILAIGNVYWVILKSYDADGVPLYETIEAPPQLDFETGTGGTALQIDIVEDLCPIFETFDVLTREEADAAYMPMGGTGGPAFLTQEDADLLYLAIDTDLFTQVEADGLYDPLGAAATAIAAHELAGDPHPQYLTAAEGNASYSVLGHTHSFASLTSTPTTLGGYGITDAASDAEVAALFVAHLAAADPHPGYLTPAEGNAAYSVLGHTHTLASLGLSANGESLVTAANYAAMRALLDLEAGTDFYSIAAADALLAAKAPLASPTFTGIPAGPTAAPGTNTTQVATTAFVTAAVTSGAYTADEVTLTLTGAQFSVKTAGLDFTHLKANANVNLSQLENILGPYILGYPLAFTAYPVPMVASTVKGLLDLSGTNTGDQTSIVGITGTLAQFNTACTDADFAPIASPALTGTPAAPTASAGTNTTQIATTAFVTSAISSAAVNLGKRARVRVATTATITIATALNNGDVLDGVTLVTGDLVLVKDQSTPAQNGIYDVGVSPARVTEFDAYDEHPGSLVAVQEGTANADTLWICTSNVGGTLNTTAISWSKLVTQGELLAANNLSDVTNAGTARTNLGLSSMATQNSNAVAITGGNINELATLGVLDNSGLGAWSMFIVCSSTYTADRQLTFVTGDASRTVTLSGNLTVSSAATVSGTHSGTSSGTNTGDQTSVTGSSGSCTGNAATATALATGRTIAMTGDVTWTSPAFTGAGNVTAAGTIADAAVTLAKQADLATQRAVGRNAAGTGVPEAVTVSQLLDWLSASIANGDLPVRSGGAWGRLAASTAGRILGLSSGIPAWILNSGKIIGSSLVATDESTTSGTLAALATADTLSVTPDETGNYTALFFCNAYQSTIGANCRACFDFAGSDVNTTDVTAAAANAGMTFAMAWRGSLSSGGSRTVRMKYAAPSGSGTAHFRARALFLIQG